MKRMRDIREKILNELDKRPGDTFSVAAIASAIGSNNKATNAALGKLFKVGLVARPQKGAYQSKGRTPQKAAAPRPPQPKIVAKPAKAAEPSPTPAELTPAPISSLSVITIELLVTGEQSPTDAAGFLAKLREDKTVLDARVSKIAAADQTKLKVRFSFPDAE